MCENIEKVKGIVEAIVENCAVQWSEDDDLIVGTITPPYSALFTATALEDALLARTIQHRFFIEQNGSKVRVDFVGNEAPLILAWIKE